MRRGVIALIGALSLAGAAHAVLPSEQLSDPTLEARARAVSSELRCLVCQNQSIDDSDAELAADIRRILRERIVAGDSDQQAKDYIVTRYGHYVLLRPPFEVQTLLLWLGPALVLLGGGVWILALARQRAPTRAQETLSDAEQAELDRRLRDRDNG